MTTYYPISKEELSEYARLKAESVSADFASRKSVDEKAKMIEMDIIKRVAGNEWLNGSGEFSMLNNLIPKLR